MCKNIILSNLLLSTIIKSYHGWLRGSLSLEALNRGLCLVVTSLRTLVTLVLETNPNEWVTINQCWAGVLSSFES
jgi:hypothetical protein